MVVNLLVTEDAYMTPGMTRSVLGNGLLFCYREVDKAPYLTFCCFLREGKLLFTFFHAMHRFCNSFMEVLLNMPRQRVIS